MKNRNSRAGRPCHNDSCALTVIFLHRFDNPVLSLQDFFLGAVLPITELQHDFASRLEPRYGLRRQRPIEIQPVR